MSDYCRNKVLRVPCDKYNLDDLELIEHKYDKLFDQNTKPYFEFEYTDNGIFLDLVFYSSYGEDCGDFGLARISTKAEQEKYGSLFKQIIPDLCLDDIHYVDYCYYNCCEAPDYYDIEEM